MLAYYEDECFEATVQSVQPGGATIAWDDATVSFVDMDGLAPSTSAMPGPGDLQPGQRVMARFEDVFWESTVVSVGPGGANIDWDDDTQSWVMLHDIRLLL